MNNSKPFVKAFFGGLLGVLVAVILVLGVGLVSKSGLAKLVEFANSLAPAVQGDGSSDGSESVAPDGDTAGGTATGTGAAVTPGTTIVVTDAALQLPEVVAEKCLPSVAAVDVYTYKSTAASGWTWGWGWGGSSTSDDADEAERTLEKSSLGSGVVLTADGFVLTNFHVIEGADVLKVTVGGAEYDATVIGTDETSDLAVVKLDLPAGVQLTPMAIGDSDALKQGQWVMTLGSPFGYGQSVATGVVSAFGRSTLLTNNTSEAGYQAYTNLIQTDAAINPGNSGGALVNAAGELVGINTLITSYSGSYSGVGFAIPVNYAFAVAQDLMAGRAPSHATLGASLVTLNASRAQRYGTAITSGVYLADVFEDTAAYAAGLRIGDVVTAIDGMPMTDSADMLLVIRGHMVGDTITLSVNRDGQVFDVQVTLGTDAERELA